MSRVVVVTGAAGAIGSAIVARFEADGDVVIGLDAVDGAASMSCDISDDAGVASTFEAIRSQHGHPTVLVNNAGMTGSGGVETEQPDDWRRIIDVNLTGAYLCAREVVGGMRSEGGGKIVNIASANARYGGSPLSGPAYAASKGGLVTLSRFLARDHAADNIQVNSITPGPHDTPMWAALDPDLRVKILEMLPGEGPGKPDDLAGVVQFLCGPSTSYLTGATIDVNGGQWMG
jgi:3-oxoacyl-[acyl-carrier protein] reductase